MLRDFAIDLLGFLEHQEAKLLGWGFYDAAFEIQEIENILFNEGSVELLDRWEQLRQKGSTIANLIDEMVHKRLLHPVDDHSELVRTRFAEGVRLIARMRQIFRQNDWSTGPRLVSDVKIHLTPRRYPKRDQQSELCWNDISSFAKERELQRQLFMALARDNHDEPIRFAGFQRRAFAHILSQYNRAGYGGSVVSASTGSGKTKAFYVPAFLGIAADLARSSVPFTKIIAVYPRNVLLADQLREAISEASKIAPILGAHRLRPLTFGALLGDTPPANVFAQSNSVFLRNWRQTNSGHVVPFLRSPRDGQSELIWRRMDREAGRTDLYEANSSQGEPPAVPNGILRLTREDLQANPPDVLFLSVEMLNRELGNPAWARTFGINKGDAAPRLLLLDEVHTHEGIAGAQFSWILGRWRVAARCPALHVVGLSATLREASAHLSKVAGLLVQNVRDFRPIENTDPNLNEIETESVEYNLAIKGNAASGTSLLATSIQCAMLGARLLTPSHIPNGIPNDNEVGDAADYYGRKAFGFTDNLDGVNRWFADLSDAEMTRRLARFRATASTNDAVVLRNMRQDGQLWELPERLHYDLQQSLRVSRCSSQDTGANVHSDVIVATSSLEVGYDDPEVGLMLHHKSPRSMSSFIQRKGRAGRRRGTRPTTMVMLSDYGIDRWLFQNSEQLFEPQVDQINLPLSNPYVIRIQVTSFLIDWLGREIGKRDPYRFLSRPTNDRTILDHARTLLSSLLTVQGSDWNAFRQDVAELFRRVLGNILPIAQLDFLIDSALWDAPRPVLRHAVPTLLRKLETNWQFADPERSQEIDDKDKNRPLPDFLPTASFSDLEQAELELTFPVGKDPQWMGVSRGLSEACPARVSKRFSVRLGERGYWLEFSLRLMNNAPEVAAVSELFPDRLFVRIVNGVQVYQPQRLSLCQRPLSVLDSSMGYWEWDSELQPLTNGTEVPLFLSDQLRGVIERTDAHLHREQSGVRVLRYAHSARYEILLPRSRVVRGRLQLRAADQAVDEAVGFEQTVDGFRFTISGLHLSHPPASEPGEVARLRGDFFLYRLQQSEVLSARTNTFNVELLWRTSLAMLTATALRQACQFREAQERLAGQRRVTAARVLDRIFGGVSADDTTDPEQGTGRQRERILELWSDEAVVRELEILERTLWEPTGDNFVAWLRERHLQTLAQAIRSAMTAIIQDVSEDDLEVDVSLLPHDEGAVIYVTETAPGGLGYIERVLEVLAREPDIFEDALRYAFDHCEQNATTLKLLSILKASRNADGALERAFQIVRQARGFSHLGAANSDLKSALEDSGFESSRQVVVPLVTRFLRPGSSAATDGLTIGLNRAWQSYSKRLGLSVDPRVFAYLCVDYTPLRRRLKDYFRRIGGETPTDSQLFAIIQDNLLSDCQDSCPHCLRNDNWFGSRVQPSRGVTRRWLGLDRADVPVDADDDGWLNAVRDRLTKEGRAHLLIHPEELELVARDIQLLLAEEFEREFVLAPVQVARLEQVGRDWSILLKVKDFEYNESTY